MDQDLKGLKLYSIQEVSNILNVNIKIIHFLISSGKLKFIPTGKKGMKISHSELLRFIEEEQEQKIPSPYLNQSTKEVFNDILNQEDKKIDTNAIFNSIFQKD